MTSEIFAETLSAINVRNGVVRMMLVDQPVDVLANAEKGETAAALSPKAIVTMPVGGFLYMASVLQNLLADEKFAKTVRAMVESGLVNAEIQPKDDTVQEGIEAT